MSAPCGRDRSPLGEQRFVERLHYRVHPGPVVVDSVHEETVIDDFTRHVDEGNALFRSHLCDRPIERDCSRSVSPLTLAGL